MSEQSNTIPSCLSPELTLNQLAEREPVDMEQSDCVCSLCRGLEASTATPIGRLRRDQIRQLVAQDHGLPWSLLPALGLVANDPLGDDEVYPGALLVALISRVAEDIWEDNAQAAEVVRRACARVARRAADPDEDFASAARSAIDFAARHWPWTPPESLDRPERWRMPTESPVETTVERLTGVGAWYEQFRPGDELLTRLQAARDAPIGELTREQLRLLIQEHEGLPWVLPMAMHLVEEDPLELTARHPGGLLIALLDIRFAVVWRHNPELVARLRAVLAGLERAAQDPEPARSQGPWALLQRLAHLGLYPWTPSPL